MRSPFPSVAPTRRKLTTVLVLACSGAAAVAPAQAATPLRAAAVRAGPLVAQIALVELRRGSGEAPRGSNAGPDVGRYRTATVGASPGSPWCAYFVSWVERAAGHPIGAGGRGVSSAGELARWARRAGRWSARPAVGALLVLPEHVGVVVALRGRSVVSVDGNWSDRVTRVRRSTGEAMGYVTPPQPEVLVMDPFAPGATG